MRRAVLFLVLTFSLYAAAQSSGGTSGGTAGSTGGAVTAGAAAAGPNVSPGLGGRPAVGPAAVAPTTNLGPSTTQPLGTDQMTSGNTGTPTVFSPFGGVNSAVGAGGYVPLLQTPEASFPSPLTSNLPNNPAGISNNPSALQSANTPRNEGVFNTGAATFGLSSGAAETRSLGEVAREYRAQRGAQQAARVFTNADIQQLNQKNGQTPLTSDLGPQSNPQAERQAPQSPTTPALEKNPAQPGQNQNLPGQEAQPR